MRVGPQRSLLFNKTGTYLYLISASGNSITKFDTVEIEKMCERKMPSAILDCIIHADGTKLLVCLKQQLYVLS